MRKMSDVAINECVSELRAACRRPIEETALHTIVGWLRPNFERILDHPSGAKRWGDFGQRMRDNARHLGAFADFFGSHVGTAVVGLDELTRAFHIIRADCTVRADSTPVAFEFCDPCGEESTDDCHDPSSDARLAERFLRSIAPAPAPLRRVG